MSALPKEKTEPAYTYADYKEWELKNGERYELIHGVPYAMSAPNLRHQAILGELHYQFKRHLQGKPCKVYAAPVDVRLFYKEDDSDNTVVQPDMIVICDEKKRGEEGCRGAPDLAVEILSPSNSAIEMERKFQLYKMAGVKEYWVIDPENKILRLCIFTNEGKYLEEIYGSDQNVSVATLPGLTVSLEHLFAAE